MTLHIARPLWNELTSELHRRTENRHESGAFLLGHRKESDRQALNLIYYDELDPAAYDSGVCILHADAFSRLWDRCSDLEMKVVADAHVHALGAGQSWSDRQSPMIARAGHIAIILPRMARPPVRRWAVGVYEYLGDHRWRACGGCRGSTLKIGE
jgi:hypothetical protein